MLSDPPSPVSTISGRMRRFPTIASVRYSPLAAWNVIGTFVPAKGIRPLGNRRKRRLAKSMSSALGAIRSVPTSTSASPDALASSCGRSITATRPPLRLSAPNAIDFVAAQSTRIAPPSATPDAAPFGSIVSFARRAKSRLTALWFSPVSSSACAGTPSTVIAKRRWLAAVSVNGTQRTSASPDRVCAWATGAPSSSSSARNGRIITVRM